MGHTTRGLVGRPDALDAFASLARVVVRMPLAQGFEFLPLTYRLADDLGLRRGREKTRDFKNLHGLSVGVAQIAARATELAGPLAFVDSDFHGGVGTQQGAVWRDGRLDLLLDSEEVLRASGSMREPDWPIPTVLRAIGVQANELGDEFVASTLIDIRDNDDFDEVDPGPDNPRF